MKNALLLIILFEFIHFNAISQKQTYVQGPEDIDSLMNELTIVRQDTSRAIIMNRLCWAYRTIISDSSMAYGQKALALSRQIKFTAGEIDALIILSFSQDELANSTEALELSLKALQVAEKNKDAYRTGWALERIGTSYRAFKNYPKALDYLYKARIAFDSIGDDKMETTLQSQLATTYLQMNQLDSGLQYAQSVFNKAAQLNIEWLRFNRLEIIAIAMGKKGNPRLALHYLQEILNMASSSLTLHSRTKYQVAKMYEQLNLTDSSIYFAQQSLADAQKGKFYSYIIDAATLLSGAYEKNNPTKAIEYDKITIAAKDSMANSGKMTAMENLLSFNEQERKYEIETAQTEYKNRVRQYSMIAGLVVVLMIALILYRNNKQKQKANKVLETTLSNLKSAQSQLIQSEKMASLGELTAGIAHEIQNPLNFVNNFSEVSNELIDEMNEELNKGDIEEAKAISADIKQNLEKINHHGKRADAIVKGMLQHSQTSTGKKEPVNINTLADEYLRLAYHGLRAKDKDFNATLKTEFNESIGNINIIPQDIGRVLLNLYNNAFYAVAEKRKQQSEGFAPTVSVSTKKIGGKVEIKVKDNGNGIPQKIVDKIFQPFFTTKPTGQGTGLGLSLSYDIIKAHGGELKVQTKEGEGSEFIILL